MNNEGSGCGLKDGISWHLPGGTEEHNENRQFRIVAVTGEVRTEHLSNVSLPDGHCYKNQFSLFQ